MYIIRDREAGNYITMTKTYEEAVKLVEAYETDDWIEDIYVEDFYEIVEAEEEVIFGGLDEYGIEVGINRSGWLYIADANEVYCTADTPENREEYIEDAKRTITEWRSEI